jgi:hypothetical protein
MQLHLHNKKMEIWNFTDCRCNVKKHQADMRINTVLELLVSKGGGITLLQNLGNCYHMYLFGLRGCFFSGWKNLIEKFKHIKARFWFSCRVLE